MLFKSLFSKKQDQQPDTELKLDEAEDWIRNENQNFVTETEERIGESYEKLGGKFSSLEEALSAFKQAEIHPEVIERLKKAAKTNKIMIEKNLQSFIEFFSIPVSRDFKSANQFFQSVSGKMGELGKKNRRGLLIVREALPETKDITRSLSELESEILEFGKMLSEKGTRIRDVEESISLARELKASIKRGPEIEKEIRSLESGLGFQKEKMEKAGKEAQEYEKSREMKKLKETRKDLEDQENKKKKLEERIIHEMANFEKALKKVEYHTKDKKSKAIKKYMENPLEALFEPDGLKKFKELVSYLKEAVRKDDFGLSEKAREKALLGIERVESGVLDWTLKEHGDLEAKISGLKRKIKRNKAPAGKKEKEKERVDWEQAIKNTHQRISDLRKENQGLGSKIEGQRKKLEEKLTDLSYREIKIT
ncbi:MAG: hypothetical protein JSV92_02755 [archaeon]|nr:MAG: hypothetical protein JSV92_02755 [archaeon]